MAAFSWSYPADELIALRAAETERERAAPVAGGIDFAALNFGYRISGDKVPWRPLRIFDDGRQLFVRSEEHTSELQSLMRISYAVFCLKKKNKKIRKNKQLTKLHTDKII